MLKFSVMRPDLTMHCITCPQFRSKNVQSSIEVGDDYNIPHWMNHRLVDVPLIASFA